MLEVKRLTIKDIARISGYGVSTVSRALNGHPDVSSQARKKIQSVVREYSFVPNTNAKKLKQSFCNSILIIVKGSFNLFFSVIIEHMQSDITKAGLNALVHYVAEEENEIKSAQNLAAEHKPLGIIFLGGNISLFQKYFNQVYLPCVLCTANAEELHFKNLSSVSVDDTDGGRQATEYLLKRGHRRIGFISGYLEGNPASRSRLNGSITSLDKFKLDYEKNLCIETCFSLQSGYQAASQLLKSDQKITAIFAMSDIMALGAVRAIYDSGLRVPDDISVIGYDGIELSSFSNPKLTTLKQPDENLASISVSLLLNMINKNVQATHIHLKVNLMEGESVKECMNIT